MLVVVVVVVVVLVVVVVVVVVRVVVLVVVVRLVVAMKVVVVVILAVVVDVVMVSRAPRSRRGRVLRAPFWPLGHITKLVDSGATCHVLSVASLECYEVVKKHDGPPPKPIDASDNEMSTIGMVDVRVKIGKLGPVVLQNVVVCDIGVNFLSPWQAALRGWGCWLSGGNDSCVIKETDRGSLWVPLVKKARSWWLIAQTPKGQGKKKKQDGSSSQPMELDAAKDSPKETPSPHSEVEAKVLPSEKGSRAEAASVSSLEVTPFKFLLRRLVFNFRQHDHEIFREEKQFLPQDTLKPCLLRERDCSVDGSVADKQSNNTQCRKLEGLCSLEGHGRGTSSGPEGSLQHCLFRSGRSLY